MTEHKTTQADKFKDAAREAGCDPDEKHWEERLKKVAGAKPDNHSAKSTKSRADD